MDSALQKELKEYFCAHEAAMKADLKAIVDVKSIASEPDGGMPYGKGVQRALETALELGRREGFKAVNVDNRIGYLHFGDEERFIGMIAHIDVVPEGEGWDTDPFGMVEREGYLLGRGVQDNKGAFVLCLYAMKYIKEKNLPLTYGMRLLIGCDEEVGMSDVRYYLAHEKAPVFTFVPDSEFPVGHGEKGIYEADLISDARLSDKVVELKGGVASNVVPEKARVTLNVTVDAAEKAAKGNPDIAVEGRDGAAEITATGIAGHAAHSEGSKNAIVILCRYLVNSGLLPEGDARLFGFVADTFSVDDGSRLGIACSDGIFTPLSCIGGMIEKRSDGRLVQNLNCRYPTCIKETEITKSISDTAKKHGFTCELDNVSPTHYISPTGAGVTVLMDVYNRVTARGEKPYVMSGGTYARLIPNAVTFGGEFPDEKFPDFVGTIHGKNEGISLATYMLAARLYTEALVELQKAKL